MPHDPQNDQHDARTAALIRDAMLAEETIPYAELEAYADQVRAKTDKGGAA